MKIEVTEVRELRSVNFWDAIKVIHPRAWELFGQWIDDYKTRNKWKELFNDGSLKPVIGPPLDYDKFEAPKFHDLPIAMQFGIYMQFLSDMQVVMEEEPIDFYKTVADTILESCKDIDDFLYEKDLHRTNDTAGSL